jgi:hypothetical protein
MERPKTETTSNDGTKGKLTRVLTLQGLRSSDLLHGFQITTGIRGGYGACGGACSGFPSGHYTVGPNHNENRR